MLIKQWTTFIINNWNKPLAQWIVQTSFYLVILSALLWIYGVNGNSSAGFIYKNF